MNVDFAYENHSNRRKLKNEKFITGKRKEKARGNCR